MMKWIYYNAFFSKWLAWTPREPKLMAGVCCWQARCLAATVANSLGEGRGMSLSSCLTASLSPCPLCIQSKMVCILCLLGRTSQQRPPFSESHQERICRFCVTHKGLFSHPSQNLRTFLLLFLKIILMNCTPESQSPSPWFWCAVSRTLDVLPCAGGFLRCFHC